MFTNSAALFAHVRRRILIGLATFLLLAATLPVAQAQRRTAMNLFPHDTLLFIRTNNAQELADRLKETGTGRLFSDPQIKPLVDRVLGEVSAVYAEEAEAEVGMSWDQLTKLPKGELAFGIIARPDGPPQFLALIDQGSEPSSARALVDRAVQAAVDDGGSLSKDTVDGVEITIVSTGGPDIGFFEKEGTIVASTDRNLLRHVLYHWSGTNPAVTGGNAAPAEGGEGAFIPSPTLDTNQKFVSIITASRRSDDPPPNVILYADPIEMVRQFGRAEPGVQIALAFFPQLGLDGILGLGGSATFSTGPYDSLVHTHILLQNPRAGILSMLAFQTGDHTPQAWVPAETETYVTARWNFQSFYARLASIVDTFRGEGSFDTLVNGPVSNQLGIDFKASVIDNLSGRMTLVAGYETPLRLQGRHNTLALELVNETAGEQTLQTVMNKFPEVFERQQFGRATFYALKTASLNELPDEQRPMNPFVAVLDNHLFVGSSINLFERIVEAGQNEIPRLANSPEYTRVSETLTAATAGMRPAVVSMSRPELTWKFWYEMLQQDSTRELVEQAAADNEQVERFAKILREGGLPPFDVLRKYFAPSGGVIYDTDNGFHGISFSLRNE